MFRSCQPRFPTTENHVKDLACLSLAHALRVNTSVLYQLYLLLGCGFQLPWEFSDVIGECQFVHVHEERQRVNKSRLLLGVPADCVG